MFNPAHLVESVSGILQNFFLLYLFYYYYYYWFIVLFLKAKYTREKCRGLSLKASYWWYMAVFAVRTLFVTVGFSQILIEEKSESCFP